MSPRRSDASLGENLQMIRESVAYFKALGKEVIYDAEHLFDGFKANPGYAVETLRAAAAGGADILVLCETNGGALPWEVEEITRKIATELAIPLGIHTHNDSGLGVANALASVQAGAVQVQGTINGYGERVGNCDLITMMAGLQLKMDYAGGAGSDAAARAVALRG